ncbi:MAG TPA: sugar ABC transporter ATP-binding protein [Anaeromyxobacteraceae bacterium]|nr:sugar ABC transporter ATP-binding protein [Anaeromyxobacteraceae bacterium]
MTGFAMIVAASRIDKSFGPTAALSSASVALRSGEIHALVGENGAGKSTMLKVIAGYEQRDAGAVTIDGRPFAPRSPGEAAANGVVLVLQELTISRALGVAENIYIDRLRDFARPWGQLRRRRLLEAAQAVLDEIGSSLSVSDRLESLELGELKILEIARALSHRPRVLLLDESTAFLNTAEIEELLRVMHVLKERGLVVGFVSHHLDEVQRVADRVTILKDGTSVGEFDVKQIDRKTMESLMVGREARHVFAAPAGGGSGEVALELCGVRFAEARSPEGIDLRLQAGEILGIGGLQGSGGHGILEGIAGERRALGGSMRLFGNRYAPAQPHDAWRAGIAYLPGDRTNEGLITEFSVLENLVMTRYPRTGPIFDRRKARSAALRSVEEFRIKTDDVDTPCSRLSGGNMQKTLLAKCLFGAPRILLLNNPTRGVDVGSRFEIYDKIRELVRARGMSVIVLTEDLIELLGLSDRIIVMNKGRVRAEVRREDAVTERDVVSHMV